MFMSTGILVKIYRTEHITVLNVLFFAPLKFEHLFDSMNVNVTRAGAEVRNVHARAAAEDDAL